MEFSKLEMEIPCPTCGEKIKIKLEDIKPGKSIRRRKCQTNITFTGDDVSKVAKELDKLFKDFQKIWKR